MLGTYILYTTDTISSITAGISSFIPFPWVLIQKHLQ